MFFDENTSTLNSKWTEILITKFGIESASMLIMIEIRKGTKFFEQKNLGVKEFL